MVKQEILILQGQLMDDSIEHNIDELCRYADVTLDDILQMVSEGIIDPKGQLPQDWRFNHRDFNRTRIIARLQHDLGVNLPGAAIIVELLGR